MKIANTTNDIQKYKVIQITWYGFLKIVSKN